MTGLDAAMEAIRRGILSVDGKGHVWLLASRDGRRKGSAMRMLPQPRRAERRSKAGYLMVHLWLDGKQYLASAHRLVYTVLVGPIAKDLTINHRDGDKTNNRPSNLEPVTQAENNLHAYRTGLATKPDVARAISGEAKRLRAQGMRYAEIAKALGVCQTTAFRAVKIEAAA